jgi:uncharacterized membrane protein
VSAWLYLSAGFLLLLFAVERQDDRWPTGNASARGPLNPLLTLRTTAALYRFRESLFLLPATIVLLGIGLAEFTARFDEMVGGSPPFTLNMNSNAATWLLSTVAGATITTAGVVFSLTVVSLQLASSQFSPRVMRSFIRDRLSQVVIGLLVATFVYSVLTLRHITGTAADPAPAISVTTAVVLTIVTVLLIVAHLDHLARSLQVGEVVQSISREGGETLAAMHRTALHEQPAHDMPERPHDAGLIIPATRDGWVTQAPSELVFKAVPAKSTVWLETRTGAYIHRGEALLVVWPRPPDPDRVQRALSATVAVADTRTMQEDVDFVIRQLVDVGLRALSPAINDPTTAVEVILRLGSLLRRLLVSHLPADVVHGPGGRTLVRPWALAHEEYIGHAFDQLRQAAPTQPAVTAALLRVLRMLIAYLEDLGRPEHVPALREQVTLVLEATAQEPTLHPRDIAKLRALADNRTDPADHSLPTARALRP